MSDNQWFRVFSIYYKGPKHEVMAAEELVSMVQNDDNCGRTEALRKIFWAGCQARREQLAEEGVISSTLDANCRRAELFRELQEEAARQTAFDELVNTVGLDRVREKAREKGVDIQAEIATYSPPVFNQTSRIEVFINAQLRDGEPHSVGDIRSAAVDAGLIPPSKDSDNHEREWSNVKQVASKMGVSDSSRTKRGYWQAVDQHETEKVS